MGKSKLLFAAAATMAFLAPSAGFGYLPSARAATTVAARAADDSSVSTTTVTRVGVVDPRALSQQTAQRAVTPRQSGGVRNVGARTLPRRGVLAPNVVAAVPQAQSATEAAASVTQNFLGLDAVDSYRVNGFDLEPPDEALCVGPTSVVQLVNLAAAVYDKTGALVAGPISANAFFDEGAGGFGNLTAPTLSDPRCYYDPQAKAFYAEIWEANFSALNESHIDLAVNPTDDPLNPWTIYRIDTTNAVSSGCPCLPDYTMIGADAHGVYLTSNNFTLAGNEPYAGESLIAISKAKLLSNTPSLDAVRYSDLMDQRNLQAYTLQPATAPFGSGYAGGTEYFVDSLGASAGTTIDNRLGVWALRNTAALDKGRQPRLSHVVVQSEIYGQPPNAVQKGSSATLNNDDDGVRQPVQNVNGTLYAALDSIVLPQGNDQTDRSGAAWFEITPSLNGNRISGATIPAQGYVALANNYLMYPAIAVDTSGNTTMGFSLSGPNRYPSAGYASGAGFSTVKVAAAGTGPDIGFTCSAPFGPPCRWGDYSAASLDPTTGTMWFAAQYIGPPGDTNANWANRIYNVAP